MKIHDAFTEYFTNLKINEGKSKRTVSSYTNDLKQYIRFLEEHSITNTKKIKAELIEEFIANQGENKASTSLARMTAAIRSLSPFPSTRIFPVSRSTRLIVRLHTSETRKPQL